MCRKQTGFTLLEAIVALVLIATIGMALFSWLNSSFISLQRVIAQQDRQMAIRNALGFMENLNPMAQPQGNIELEEHRLTWSAHLIEPIKDGQNITGEIGFYQVGLYVVEVTLHHQNQLLATLSLRQVGYKQVRKPDLGL